MRLFVEIGDLRKALKAVAPHSHPDPEVTSLHRVHFMATNQNLFVQATNQYSIGLGLVSVWDSELTGSPADDQFSLTPAAVKEIDLLFREAKDKDDGAGDLQIIVRDEEIEFTDVSGLFPGKSFTIPRTHLAEPYPNVPSLILSRLQAGRALPAKLATNGRLVKLFAAAAQTYGEPLVLEPSGENGSILVSCGESFLGALMPIKTEETSQLAKDIETWKTDWGIRLSDLALALVAEQEPAA